MFLPIKLEKSIENNCGKMTYTLDCTKLKYIKLEFIKEQYEATIIDQKGFEIVKGYGTSPESAINDLIHGLI
jgi:hypothetical protein